MGTSSVKNGRDSQAKSRGVKVLGGQPVKAGGIIVRQLGNKWYPGRNVGKGGDYTLFSKEEGIVVFERIKSRKSVSVYPLGHEKATGWHLEMQPNSRKAQRLARWKNTPRGRQPGGGLRPGPFEGRGGDGGTANLGAAAAAESAPEAPQEPAAAVA